MYGELFKGETLPVAELIEERGPPIQKDISALHRYQINNIEDEIPICVFICGWPAHRNCCKLKNKQRNFSCCYWSPATGPYKTKSFFLNFTSYTKVFSLEFRIPKFYVFTKTKTKKIRER